MTKAEAHQILGTGGSVSRSKAELLYREKYKKLRLQMIPGMPVATRQKALAELARVDTAWKTLQAPGSAKPAAKRPATKKPARPRSGNVIPYRKPQTLAEAWEQVVALSPFSEAVTAIITITVFLLTIMSLLRGL